MENVGRIPCLFGGHNVSGEISSLNLKITKELTTIAPSLIKYISKSI
jgi:hypothetical protein